MARRGIDLKATGEAHIVAFAYVCAPGQGSEPGSGWSWARILAGLGETWVIYRPYAGMADALAARLAVVPERDHLHLVPVELPRWAGFVTTDLPVVRHQRLQYLIWQALALREARRLHRRVRFDLSWHLTWANIWMGTAAALVGPPLVYGPAGGGVDAPWRLLPELGVTGAGGEVLRYIVRRAARLSNPLVRLSWRRARLILAQNPETLRFLPRSVRGKAAILPNVVFDEVRVTCRTRVMAGKNVGLVVGRLLPLKGVALALRALEELPGWTLIVCGDGPDRARLEALVTGRGLGARVRFLGQLPREEVLRLMREEADVLLFPSLHEEGGWAVAEAAANGLPVVCLDRGGPPMLGGHVVVPSSPRGTARDLARAAQAAVVSARPLAQRRDVETTRERLLSIMGEHNLLD